MVTTPCYFLRGWALCRWDVCSRRCIRCCGHRGRNLPVYSQRSSGESFANTHPFSCSRCCFLVSTYALTAVHLFVRGSPEWTGPACYNTAGASIWRAAHRLLLLPPPLLLLRGHCVFGDEHGCALSPPPLHFQWKSSGPQTWGPPLPCRSFSAVSDGLRANLRRRVRAVSSCWRASVSSAIPPAPSATDMSFLNALPVELVSFVSDARTLNTARPGSQSDACVCRVELILES